MGIMNKEDDWDHMTEANMVKGSIEKIIQEETVIVIKAMKPGMVTGPSYKVCADRTLPTYIAWERNAG